LKRRIFDAVGDNSVAVGLVSFTDESAAHDVAPSTCFVGDAHARSTSSGHTGSRHVSIVELDGVPVVLK
jgi:hypothetical protein